MPDALICRLLIVSWGLVVELEGPVLPFCFPALADAASSFLGFYFLYPKIENIPNTACFCFFLHSAYKL